MKEIIEKLANKIVNAIILWKFGKEKYDFFINSDSLIVKAALETIRYNIAILLIYAVLYPIVILFSSIILIIRYV